MSGPRANDSQPGSRRSSAVTEQEIAAGLAPTPGYRYADLVGDRLYVAGQVPNDANGDLVGAGDVAAQARACLDNLMRLVTASGFTRDDIHRLTISVVGDRPELGVTWTAVVAWFGGEVPPATLVGVRALGYAEQLVEIDADVARA